MTGAKSSNWLSLDNMTALGFHYFPDETHYRSADLQAWLPELHALGARWLTLVGSINRAVPEPFVKGLIEARIEPIIHIPAGVSVSGSERDIGADLVPLFETYARWGAKYVVVFSEPNMRSAWASSDWGTTSLVERFLDVVVPVLQAQAGAGLRPTFPPLRAGGDYWDTAFLDGVLVGLARRGQSHLARQVTVAVNLWTFGRPVDWGAGGTHRWPEARPYLTPPGSQDQRGFHLFEWYDEIIRARCGETRPMICLAAGPRLSEQDGLVVPSGDDIRHASCIEQIVRATAEGALPTYLLNVNLWLLSAGVSSPLAGDAWYRPDGSTLAAVAAIKSVDRLGQTPERRMWNESQALEGQHRLSIQGKALRHYVLLPLSEPGMTQRHWGAILDFAREDRPAFGYSPDEAAQAQHVTILGDEQDVSRQVEAALRAAGCVVDRIP